MTETRADGFVLTRVFDAPVDLLWRCFTEQQHLAQWSAPRGYTITQGAGDLRIGGQWRCCMRDPDGAEHWLGGTYREIVPGKLLVMTHAWEENGKVGPETLVTVRFEDQGGRSKVTLEQTGFASDAERDGHREGWGECFDRLAAHLATMG